jgi:hypothetical protein
MTSTGEGRASVVSRKSPYSAASCLVLTKVRSCHSRACGCRARGVPNSYPPPLFDMGEGKGGVLRFHGRARNSWCEPNRGIEKSAVRTYTEVIIGHHTSIVSRK